MTPPPPAGIGLIDLVFFISGFCQCFIMQDRISITMGVDMPQEFIEIYHMKKRGMLIQVLDNPYHKDDLIIVFVKDDMTAQFLIRILFEFIDNLGTGLPPMDESS